MGQYKSLAALWREKVPLAYAEHESLDQPFPFTTFFAIFVYRIIGYLLNMHVSADSKVALIRTDLALNGLHLPYCPFSYNRAHWDAVCWATILENTFWGICVERRFRSDCAFAQSDLSLRWFHIPDGTSRNLESLTIYKAPSVNWANCLNSKSDLRLCGRTYSKVHFLTLRPKCILLMNYVLNARLSYRSYDRKDKERCSWRRVKSRMTLCMHVTYVVCSRSSVNEQ